MLCHSVQGASASHFCERNSNPRTHISFLSSIFSRRFHLCFFFFSLYFLRSTWSALKRSGPRSNLRFFSAPCGCLGNENVCVVHIQQPEKRRPRAHPPSIPPLSFSTSIAEGEWDALRKRRHFLSPSFLSFLPQKIQFSWGGGVYIIEKKEKEEHLSLFLLHKSTTYISLFF